MIAEVCDDTKNPKLFIRFFHFFDSSKQTSKTSVRKKKFLFCKILLKQMQCGIWQNNKNRAFSVVGPSLCRAD